MADEESKREDEEDRREEEEEVEKAYDVIADTLKAVVESQKTILESHKALATDVNTLFTSVDSLQKAAQDGAYKSPSGSDASVDLKPKVQDSDDIGAEVASVPAEPYEQGEQAKLDGDKTVADKPETDDVKTLEVGKAQTFTTETPRPNASPETVNKSYTEDYSQILKDARSVGHDGLSDIALKIQNGYYYKPSDEEVGLI
tara:strand:- start:221 stop:823 length:603 start_codon:yes stop_codon:yes gene_type:complete